jgi:hypothetical protein
MPFLVPMVAIVCVFSFVIVARWSDNRRKERESFYKSETLKKIAETQGAGGGSAVEFLRQEEMRAQRRRLEGQKLGGLITIAVGVGMIVFLRMIPDTAKENAYYVGVLPLLIGVALLVYAYFVAPKE